MFQFLKHYVSILNATETEKLIGASTLEFSGLGRLPDEAKEISDDLFRIVSDWYYFAILNLFDTEDLRPDAVWISRRLGIASSLAKFALDRLERVGLLVRVKGVLKVESSFVMSTSGIPSSAIRNYHRQILKKAIVALETEPVDERDITGIGLAIDLRDLPDLVAEIRKFRNRIASKYSRGKRTEVYQLEMALFKISKKIKQEKNTMLKQLINTSFLLLGICLSAHAATTWVGNGDDGSDLEGSAPLISAKINHGRASAVVLLHRLNIEGIPGLGMLLPETERSILYMSKVDSDSKLASDKGIFHADMKGRVFARTLPEPHAPTRFFPIAEKLDEDQLVALNIHEAFHRSLPASIREDEAVVSELTLAIVSPEASFDSVKKTAARLIPEEETKRSGVDSIDETKSRAPEGSLAHEPSFVGYEFRTYQNNSAINYRSRVESMHLVRSFLYPFGKQDDSIGIGIEAGVIKKLDTTVMGPLELSGRMRIWSERGFDIGAWAVWSLNTLSAAELKNSPFGRDVGTVGLQMRKDLKWFYIENLLGYSFSGTAVQSIGKIDYTYSYGGVVSALVHPGLSIGGLKLGPFAELFLADYYRVSGGHLPGLTLDATDFYPQVLRLLFERKTS